MSPAAKMFRQGDILLVEIEALPENLLPVLRDDDGGVTIALGEATGHRHRFMERHCSLFKDAGVAFDLYLSIDGANAQLVHEEHAGIAVPHGHYQIVRQREYMPDRNVVVDD